jgi:hypothetical protein
LSHRWRGINLGFVSVICESTCRLLQAGAQVASFVSGAVGEIKSGSISALPAIEILHQNLTQCLQDGGKTGRQDNVAQYIQQTVLSNGVPCDK